MIKLMNYLIGLCFFICQLACQAEQITQAQLDYLANNLVVKYHFLSNIEKDCPKNKGKVVKYCYGAELWLTSPDDLAANNFHLNFSHVYPVYASNSEHFSVKVINGDIHQVTPKPSFMGFQANKTEKIKIWLQSTLLTQSELMPNYWVSSVNLQSKVVKSTKVYLDDETQLEQQPYVMPLTNMAKQIKSAPNDINAYASPSWLYQQTSSVKPQPNHKNFVNTAIIPTPKSVKLLENDVFFDFSTPVTLILKGIQQSKLMAAIKRLSSFNFKLVNTTEQNKLIVEINEQKPRDWRSGHYQLNITQHGIHIIAQDDVGAFYGLQSIASLVSLDSTLLPLMNVDDQPHYAYRGQHVDVGRNFHSIGFIFRLIEQMSAYKLNKLHLHLAEDEGWRLEIPGLPELTQVGSKRCMNLSDEECLQPQLGGADAGNRDGYYSVQDYQEIVRFANEHYVQVIPSLDMPGHSRAAIKSMEARYRFYKAQGDLAKAQQYLLTDFSDKTQYSSIQNYHDNTLNVCMDSTYRFIEKVLSELQKMHKKAGQPLTLYHIGADETAGAWLDSPVCAPIIAAEGKAHLGAQFIERVANIAKDKGINIGGWNDGLKETRTANMPVDTYSYIWDALPWGAHQQVSEQSHRGWHVILSLPDVLYFDFPYQIDPKERGYNWASRRITTRSLFYFMPDNLPIHAEFRLDTLGHHFVSDDRVQKDKQGNITHQPLATGYQVNGIQGQLWSETVHSDQQAEYMLYPRLFALAERAWHKASWQVPYDDKGKYFDKDSHYFTEELKNNRDQAWWQFSTVLGEKVLPKLEQAGVFYRLPTVGAVIKQGTLYANCAINGIAIEYKDVQGVWQKYTQPVEVTPPVKVRTRTTDGKRAGRAMVINR